MARGGEVHPMHEVSGTHGRKRRVLLGNLPCSQQARAWRSSSILTLLRWSRGALAPFRWGPGALPGCGGQSGRCVCRKVVSLETGWPQWSWGRVLHPTRCVPGT